MELHPQMPSTGQPWYDFFVLAPSVPDTNISFPMLLAFPLTSTGGSLESDHNNNVGCSHGNENNNIYHLQPAAAEF